MIQVFVALLLAVFSVEINAQGEACTAFNQQPAVCRLLNDCPFLKNLYANDKSKATADKLIESQRICGNRAVGRVPILCCPDPNRAPAPGPARPNDCPGCGNAGGAPFDISTVRGLFTPQQGCGYSNITHPRVVGGVPSKLGGWPWMALLGYRNDFGDVSFKCGGSLISRRHVLSAAHCMRRDLALVRLGEHDLGTDAETRTVQIDVAQQIVHPNYDRKDGHSDIAILVLKDAVKEFGFTIRPVCIPLREPERSANFEGRNPFVAGWGRTTEGGKSSNVLMEVQFPVLRNEDCRTRYQNLGRETSPKQFDAATLCAGVLEGGKDACQGDSGGPLMVPIIFNEAVHYHQIGIVSYGIGCARADVPGVYTRVQHFADWINEKVEST